MQNPNFSADSVIMLVITPLPTNILSSMTTIVRYTIPVAVCSVVLDQTFRTMIFNVLSCNQQHLNSPIFFVSTHTIITLRLRCG